MSMHLRLKIDARCRLHPRYDPERDGRPAHKDCPGCESLYVIWLYAGIAAKKAENGEGLARSSKSGSQPSTDQLQATHPLMPTAPTASDDNRDEMS